MTALQHRLDRTIFIQASPETVFSYFTDSSRWAAWWGAGSTIDARPGGRVFIRYPTGDEASGEVVQLHPPERIVFTYGYVRGTPVAPGESLVTIHLESTDSGTRLHLAHEFAEAAVVGEHLQGWRYQLSLFSNLVADEVHAAAGPTIDAWFAAWVEPDQGERERSLARVAAANVQFRDRFSAIDGIAELVQQIGAAQRFMPGVRIERSGAIRHCQGRVLVDWVAKGPDGAQRGAGVNLFELQSDGRIGAVTGFWNPGVANR
jgi:uncharacterized protein YndB with AHSA1/START domain